MPLNKPQTQRPGRPAPKERAANLRAAATRAISTPAAPVDGMPDAGGAQPNADLVRLIREHGELLAAGNDGGHPEVIADALINRAFALFYEACEIPAATSADLVAKFGMIGPELRHAAESCGSMAKLALDTLSADLRRVLPVEPPTITISPVAFEGLPDPRTIAGAFPVEGLPMRDIARLHGTARAFADVGSAVGCQPSSLVDRGGFPVALSPAGTLAEWLTDIADWVMDYAQREAKSRRPSDEDEASNRFYVIAHSTGQNDDPAEMRALARDLDAQAARIEARRSARG